jgi:hypothetical protein
MRLDALLHALQYFPPSDHAFNPYAHPTRRDNLARYLRHAQARGDGVLMVMEAPGYRGCRLTGIPVTSRQVMLEGVPALQAFGDGYTDAPEAGFEAYYREQSATIVWELLARLNVLPLLWNAFPLHPHQAGKPASNRTPTPAEVTQGRALLAQALEAFAPRKVIAVGNVAHSTLIALGVACHKVRHPAQGGKHDFVAGMERVLG